jgi:PAS domain S-box-containing protein
MMQDNGPITTTEVSLSDDGIIVSKTNAEGCIVFVNSEFAHLSGFSTEELIGAPQYIVRHPHMPSVVFADLWETISAGATWEGMIKNRTKSGAFYWARTTVAPIVEQGRITGYFAVRTKPQRQEIEEAEALYARIRSGAAPEIRFSRGAVVDSGPKARLRETVLSLKDRMIATLRGRAVGVVERCLGSIRAA